MTGFLPILLVAHMPFSTPPDSFAGAKDLDAVIGKAVDEGRIPGAVLVVGHDGKVVYRKAYGKRSLEPTVEPMTLDTVFDCASLTKVVATTSCLMRLYEAGKFRLNDHITDYIPEFQHGKSSVTLRNLMTHFSGLKPDVPLKPDWTGYDKGIELACNDEPAGPPGEKFVYSDINFILLGELVHRLSGKTLDAFAHDEVFAPLGMKDTTFVPPASWIPRIAPTERMAPNEAPLRGVVHDPSTRNMGGVAGHAGVFSTGDDLSRFCQMMLNDGTLDHRRIFNPLTIEKFTEPQTPTDQPILRGLGWDIDSPYSSNRGELFPIGSFGHTGFTGTSIWIDPASQTYVILLTNSVHPISHGGVISLRSKVATIVAAAVGVKQQGVDVTGYNETSVADGRRREFPSGVEIRTGLDQMESDGFKSLVGKKVGLITNQTGIDRDGKRNVDLMVKAGVKVTALFSPEHGFGGQADHPGIANTTDEVTGIPVYSLYGETNRPTADQLRDVDVLVYDIQDVGVRFYTYETTLAYCLEEAARAGKPFWVLDRPNPITGVRVEGPALKEMYRSFVGYLAGEPIRHGMTVGELAQLFNGERYLGVDLHVQPMLNWDRGSWFDASGQPWVNPSPNMRSLNAATLYPGLCLLEGAKNWSVGRGTDAPFEQVGADFVNGPELAMTLNKRRLAGVRFYATTLKPTASNFAGQTIGGVRIVITDRETLDAVRLGIEIAVAVQKLYPGKLDYAANKLLFGDDDLIKRIEAGQTATEIIDSYRDGLSDFRKIREKYLLYR